MTPPADPTRPEAVVRRQARRGPVLLVRLNEIPKLEEAWCSRADIVQLFREAQRVAR
jgi:hypothetical protein